MTTIIEYTADDILTFLAIDHVDEDNAEELVAANVRGMNVWLARGDGIAVYENHDLGHWALGHKVFFSFGSPEAAWEDDTPPQNCPFNLPHGLMHWRYVLVGTYRGGPL